MSLAACARFRQHETALEVLDTMTRKGVEPDVLACATAMEALAGAQRWDDVFAVFETIRAKGLKPDIKCYTQVLHQATLAGRWDLFPGYLQEAVMEARAQNTSLDLRFFGT